MNFILYDPFGPVRQLGYTYDAKGADTLYYYDEAGHILGIYDAGGALAEEIVWLEDTPIATLRPAAGGGVDMYAIHTDRLNTPRLITDSVNAAVRWRGRDPIGCFLSVMSGTPMHTSVGALGRRGASDLQR